jgi:hypothetical protein
MPNRLEELWKSADDGAYSPIGPSCHHADADFDDLLDAWYLERQNRLEFEILLAQSKVLIARLIEESYASPVRRKQARRLLRAITHSLKPVDAEE